MGVTGLWKLLEGNGRQVELHTLEGKILAVDISIWLNMAIKGMRGQSANNAHLITLFHRICKLLYFGIKPVFVFDGGAPALKQRTLKERRQKKDMNIRQSKNASEKVLQNYLKRQVLQLAIKSKDGEKVSSSSDRATDSNNETAIDTSELLPPKGKYLKPDEDIFHLPPMKEGLEMEESDEEREEQWKQRSQTRDVVYGSAMQGDFHEMMQIDVNSDDFQSMPSDIKHELLMDIQEIRKRRRTQLEAMPDKSDSFSNYQLSGLLAKRKLTTQIRGIENQMKREHTSANTHGYQGDVEISQISSDNKMHYVLLRGLKKRKAEVEKEEKYEEMNSLKSNLEFKSDSLPSFSEEIDIVKSNTESTVSVRDDSVKTINISSDDSADLLSSNVELVENKISKKTENKISEQNDRIVESSVSPKKPKVENSLVSPTQSLMLPIETTTKEILNSSSEFGKDNIIKEEATNNTVITQQEPTLEVEKLEKPEIVQPSAVTNINQFVKSLTAASAEKVVGQEVICENEIAPAAKVDVSKEELLKKNEDLDESDDDFVEVVDRQGVVLEDEEQSVEATPITQQSLEELPPAANPWVGMQKEDINELEEKLDAEDAALLERIKSASRAAREVSDVATMECQELLRLFGIPFVLSPQEAEAQCAFLDMNDLTMGTITEDSDVWLFGGKNVYKDMFDRKRDPTCYSLLDIQAELGLLRSHFINIALCSGSDYTEGLEGVGPVRALEIMKEFPGEGMESLVKFKQWWDDAHAQVKPPTSEAKIKTELRRLNVPQNFPSKLVVEAYLKPRVNESKDKFVWGMPDLSGIRDYLTERLHWTRNKIDEELLPVLKKSAERATRKQTYITSFAMKTNPLPRKQTKKSKRVMRALTPLVKFEEEEESKPPKRGRKKKIDAKPEPKTNSKVNNRKRISRKKTKPISPEPVVDLRLSESSSDIIINNDILLL
uniref:DNA repair protein complementing XP-G cells-like isoform X1 n=2 Tax=Ciona intestinalis TaxID=7719 RepID=UPI000180BF99|nr:DNA repair protein complementing XP-G cells-like isoform X1 [Ciona intestinalis]|eukprot:XP_002121987.1 DNA repair protein complementing XP-G cells-like isoform X1 [Ciona intestinalis]